MYSRSYYPEFNEKTNLPDNYDGTAFMDRGESIESSESIENQTFDNTDTPVFKKSDGRNEDLLSGLGKSPIFSNLFAKNGLLGGLGLHMPRIGTEEILILATAAFLFFSQSGDKECALILLLLLFIN